MKFSEIRKEETQDLEILHELEDVDVLKDFLVDYESDKAVEVADKLESILDEGKCLREVFGLSEKVMKLYYSCASDLFKGKEYAASANAFIFMTMMDPYVYDYWMPLGLSEHVNSNHEAALRAYSMAILTRIDDPSPHFFAGRCYLDINDVDNARKSFELAVELAEDFEQHKTIKSQAEAMLAKC